MAFDYDKLSPSLKRAVDSANLRDGKAKEAMKTPPQPKPKDSCIHVYNPDHVVSRVTVPFIFKGKVMSKPRMTRGDRWKKRPCVLAYWAWKDDLNKQFPGHLGMAISLSWDAYIKIPKSWSKKKKAAMMGQPHRQKPDRDNIDKAILDALFPEDKTISSGLIAKFWEDEKGERIEMAIVYEQEVEA